MSGARGANRLTREAQKPSDGWAVGRRLLGLFRPEARSLAVVFGLVVAGSGLGLLLPLLIGRVIDALASSQNIVGVLLLVLAGTYLLDAGLSWAESRWMAGLTQRLVAVLRARLFETFIRLPASFFDARSPGDLMSRMTNDVDNLSTSVTQSTLTLLGGGLQAVAVLGMMLVLSPWLTLTALLSVVLVLSVSRFLGRRTRNHFRLQQTLLGELNNHLEESLTGLEVVEAFGRQPEVEGAFRRLNARLTEAGSRAQLWSGLMMPLMNVISNLSFALVAWAGGALALGGVLTVGTVATFLLYSRQFSRPINELANVYSVLQTALAGAERLFALFDEPPEAPDAPDARPLTEPRGRVEFQVVSFAYREAVPVLSGLSFVIPEGTSLALVGPTGSGKTTIVNLLLRFYEATAGRILIDGADLHSFSRNSLRQNFGVVLQEAWLFRGTIEENIAFGRPSATADEIRSAAVRARCDAFVRQLPDGYATVLTENGAPLSQGQRQLVAIARALLADPAFLILDEATSNVDTRTELQLQNAVREALHGRTSIVIAHRLSTIRDAGRILFLEGGRVVESGTHDELMRANGRYRAMLNLQKTAPDAETADSGG